MKNRTPLTLEETARRRRSADWWLEDWGNLWGSHRTVSRHTSKSPKAVAMPACNGMTAEEVVEWTKRRLGCEEVTIIEGPYEVGNWWLDL